MNRRNLPELLCPAGDPASLEAALHFGADAVYGGLKRFGLRAFAGNFDPEELRRAVDAVHAAGRKFYLTMNSLPYDDEMEAFVEAGREAMRAGVDAVIVSDLGAIRMLKREVPALPVHVSTQANTLNTPAIEQYLEMGCERVILARELSLDRIRTLAANVRGRMELEVFVHGASCMAYSGRCLLSAYLTGRSGNRGACTQPCRWKYSVMEEKRPGEYYPVAEDENGTYLFSAKDLCLMPLLSELAEAGISSFKIEGRMKSEYYVAVVTGAYRRALELLGADPAAFREALPELLQELNSASHRDSDTGFLLGAPEQPGEAEGFHQEREYLARVISGPDESGLARLELKNRFYTGDQLELMTPKGILPVVASGIYREKTGEWTDTLGVGGEVIRMALPACSAGDLLRGPVRNHRK